MNIPRLRTPAASRATGIVCVARVPWHRVGLVLAIAPVAMMLGELGRTYGEVAVERGWPVGPAVAAIASPLWLVGILLVVVYLPLLFPTGFALSPRWGWVGRAAAVGVMGIAISWIFQPGELRDLPGHTNPLGVTGAGSIFDSFQVAEPVLVLASVTGALASLVARLRRSRGVERQQMKWLVFALLAAVGLYAVAIIGGGLIGFVPPDAYFLGTLVAIPIAVRVAILRHKLYDIDVLLNRTLVYGSLTAATAASYVLLVVLFGWLARAVAGRGSNAVAVAATTLVVAALFQPARRRLQSFVDRRFYRAKYDAARTLEVLQLRL